jgi:hypothetical protein
MSASASPSTPDLPRAEVLSVLDRLLDSPQFRTSKKCSRFFRHIVEATLDHRLSCLKERTIGVDVFEREPHYDTNQDPIVRGTAGEVRKRLAQYYHAEGATDLYHFSLPAGSYIPEIHPVAHVEIVPPVIVETLSVLPKRRTARSLYVVAGSALAAVAALASVLLYTRGQVSPVEEFWGPLLGAKQSPVVCMGQPQMYTFRPEIANPLNAWYANSPDRRTGKPPFKSVPVDAIVPMWSETVALSDCQALLRLSNLFASRSKSVVLRGESSASLTELRGRPTILIGAFDNAWTIDLTGELRFYFDQESSTHEQIIRDRRNPTQSKWKLINAWPPTKDIRTDYALVTRVVHPTTEGTVVTLAGISEFGTEAAAEFVTTPTYLVKALARAPADWSRKNLQVVLSTTVMSNTSGPPQIVAVHSW